MTEVLASADYFFFFLGGPIGCLCGLPGFGGGIGTFGALTGGLTGGLIGFFGGGIGISAGSIGCGGALYFFDIESFSIVDRVGDASSLQTFHLIQSGQITE